MLTHCGYCSINTAGEHQQGCPNRARHVGVTYQPYPHIAQPMPRGWECPKCGRIYAPSFPMCTYCPEKPKAASDSDA